MTMTETFVKMILDRWNGALKSWDSTLQALTDEQLQRETAPGKNRGIYLLGHMIAVHDDMLVLLDMGDKLYPQLHFPFLESPDKVVAHLPDASELRAQWTQQCAVLNEKMASLQADRWFEKHTAVSEEDFSREPNRNKLNIILTRTTHLTYHTGQLVLLK